MCERIGARARQRRSRAGAGRRRRRLRRRSGAARSPGAAACSSPAAPACSAAASREELRSRAAACGRWRGGCRRYARACQASSTRPATWSRARCRTALERRRHRRALRRRDGGRQGRSRAQLDRRDAPLVEAAADAGVKRLVHISSVAVLKPRARSAGRWTRRRRSTPATCERGPYVWGKAESEVAGPAARARARRRREDHPARAARRLRRVRAARPARARARPAVRRGRPAAQRPQRLRRRHRGARDPLATSRTSAAAPPVLNLVDGRRRRARADGALPPGAPDLRVFWVPAILLRTLSPFLKLLQRMLTKGTPIDVYAAFAAERYRTDLAASVIARASALRPPEPAAATR